MSIEGYILKAGEKGLLPYRAEAVTLRSDPNYKKYLPRIQKALAATSYWHGTGRYHYRYIEDRRYGEIDTENTVDILKGIIAADGLKPHLDPWIDSGGRTVSLGTARMHSRAFARVCLYESDTLLYELGSIRYWARLYSIYLFLWLSSNLQACQLFLKALFRRSSTKDMQAWAGAVRKPKGKKVMTLKTMWSGESLSSDIEGNYPILIGVAKENLSVIDVIPLTHAVEVRSLNTVHFKDIVYLEVPLARVTETKALLIAHNIEVEVLPMEYVDVYMSTIPLRQLAYT